MNDVNRKLLLLTPLNPEVLRQRLKTESSLIAHSMTVALEEDEAVREEECLEIGESLRAEERESLIVVVDRIRGKQ